MKPVSPLRPSHPIQVSPVKGSAILWPSVYSNSIYETDMRTQHESLPVIRGRKYAANFWQHMYNFQDALQHNCGNQNYLQVDALYPGTPTSRDEL